MTQRPVDQAATHRYPKGRRALWAAIRRLKTFTTSDLVAATDMQNSSVMTYLKALQNGGYLEREDSPPANTRFGIRFQSARWTLVRDTGVQPPTLNADGSPRRNAPGQDQMWRAMKVLGRFNFRELAIAASTEDHIVTPATATTYCQALAKAGYLKCVRPSQPGTPATYQLLPSRNSGPSAPQIQRTKAVWDPNIERVVWTAVGGVQ